LFRSVVTGSNSKQNKFPSLCTAHQRSTSSAEKLGTASAWGVIHNVKHPPPPHTNGFSWTCS